MSAIARPIIRALTLLLVAATLAVGLAGPASAAGNVASVADAGELEGTITTTDGLDFTGTLTAYWWSDDNEFIFWDSVSFDGATSGATYSFTDVAPGDYYVEYLDESDTYASGYGNGASGPAGAPGDPGTVHVTAAVGKTANVTLAPLPAKQPVTGNVEDTDGAPLADISVEAIRNFGEHDSAAAGATDEGGSYALDLRPGSYELLFTDTSGSHSDTTTTIEVGNGPLTVDPVVMLPTQSSVTFKGRIFGSDAKGLPYAKVWLVELLGEPGHFHTAIWPSDPIRAGAQGYYTIDNVERDAYYTVAASGYMHRRGFVDGAADVLQAGAFYADANQTGVDVHLADRTTGVRGQVTSPYGPVAGVQVQVYLWLPDETVPFFDVFDEATTDEDGNYAIDELPAGDYALRFNAEDAAVPVRTAWLGNDADVPPAGPGAAGVFHVVDGTPRDVDGDRVLQAVKSSSTTAAKLAKTKITAGKSTNVTVTVKVPGLSAPTGKVKVYDGTKVLKTVTLAAAKKGVVVVKLVKPKKGKHKISAQYLGTGTVLTSTSKVVTLKVT